MITREAFFLDTPNGSRFALVTRPSGTPRGAWLYIHPFAEEMNKSRRMIALAAEAFAEHGWFVLQGDLKGCGDSDGDFGDASWQDWVRDVAHFWNWLEQSCSGIRGLWCLRSGCLLASAWLEERNESLPLLLWQPTTSGDRHLNQFLRLKAANELLSDTKTSGTIKGIREELDAGNAIEVAGYLVSPPLASGLSSARLRLSREHKAPIILLEVASGGRRELSPAVDGIAREWRTSGVPVTTELVEGPSFWQTTEIETAPELTSASLRILGRLSP